MSSGESDAQILIVQPELPLAGSSDAQPWKARKLSSAEHRRKKQWEKTLRRHEKLKAKRRVKKPTGWGKLVPALELLRGQFQGKDLSLYDPQRDAWVVRIPKRFCFLSNPDETLDTLYTIVAISKKPAPKTLYIDYSKCEELDLGASAVLDILTMYLRYEWRAKPGRTRISGKYPADQRVRNLLQCTGLTRHLRIRGAEPDEAVDAQFIHFRLFRGHKRTQRRNKGATDQEIAATKLANYLDECFQRMAKYRLTDEGKRHILKWAGEVIANAEEHSGRNDWFAIGYMAPVETTNQGGDPRLGECHLVVFNFGRSIYDSLSNPSIARELREAIAGLVEKHLGFFNVGIRYAAFDLWTLYALQDGITRYSAPGKSTRGKGTVDMIMAFQRLGGTLDPQKEPEMALISGRTRIYFTKRYGMVSKDGRKIIAFNSNNALEDKPDSNHVHSLDGKFPGTLLTFKFFIDRAYLDKMHATVNKHE